MRSARTLLVALALAAVLTGVGAFALSTNAQEAKGTVAMAGTQSRPNQEEARGWLGIAIANLDQKLADKLGITATSGVAIIRVVDDSPAHDANLRRGDVISKVNGATVATVEELKNVLKDLKAGDAVTLSITNSSGTRDVQLTAEAVTQRLSRPKAGIPGHLGMPFLGAAGGIIPELRDIPRDELFSHLLGAEYRLTDKDGNPLIAKVDAGTVASADAGILNVNLNGGGQQQFSLNSEVRFMPKNITAETIKDGAKVVVVSVNGQVRAVMALVKPKAGDPGARGQRQGHPGGAFFEKGELRPRLDGLLERHSKDTPRKEIESVFNDLRLKTGSGAKPDSL